MEQEDILIVIPAFNEAAEIGSVVANTLTALPVARPLVVNDGSTDGTADAARSAGAVVLSHPFNMGYGAALQTGYKYALENDYQTLIQLDGDGQHDPTDIPRFLEALEDEDVDIVIGSRFLENKSKVSFTRRTGIRIFARLASLATGLKVTDPLSGYKAMKRPVLEFLVQDLYPEDYPDADLIIMLHRAGFRIREIPVTVAPSPHGKSMHKGLKPLYYIYKMMLSMLLTMFRGHNR